jgi:hypothetical protein
MSLVRNLRIKEGITLSIRADFQNIFNRLIFGNTASTNAKCTQRMPSGMKQSSFGEIDTTTTAATSPRRYAGCPTSEMANSVLFAPMLLFRLAIARFLGLKPTTCIPSGMILSTVGSNLVFKN